MVGATHLIDKKGGQQPFGLCRRAGRYRTHLTAGIAREP